MRALLSIVILATLLVPALAWPCETDDRTRKYVRDSSLEGVDVAPPAAAVVRRLHVSRRRAPLANDQFDPLGCEDGSDSTSGGLRIAVAPPEDDHAEPFEVGHRVEIVSGSPPRGLQPGPFVVDDGALFVPFDDRDDDDPIDFHIRLVTVDTAGNEGPPSEVVHVHSEGVGCTSAPGAAAPLAWLALLLVRRRR